MQHLDMLKLQRTCLKLLLQTTRSTKTLPEPSYQTALIGKEFCYTNMNSKTKKGAPRPYTTPGHAQNTARMPKTFTAKTHLVDPSASEETH